MNDQAILDKLERENITLADFGRRILAYFIDNIILSLVVFIIFYDSFSQTSDLNEIREVLDNFIFGFIFLHISYHTLFTFMYGASLGKMVCKIMIIDQEVLDKPNFSQSLIRSFIRQLSGMAFMLGFAWAFGNILRKTWQDYVARTIVINVA